MNPRAHEPPAMDTDGAEVRLGGGPLPPGAAEHLESLVNSLYAALEPPPKVKKSQSLSQADVLVQSAFALIEDDLVAAQEQFAEREASIDEAGGDIPGQEQKIAAALDGLRGTFAAALAAGIRFTLHRDE